ncbi:MAG: response regulator [Spirochaetales bacterium]|nr:response regulator [Spirochaetales bacterium]
MNSNTDYYRDLLNFIPAMKENMRNEIPDDIPEDHPVRQIYEALFKLKQDFNATIEKTVNSEKDIIKEKQELIERVDLRTKFLMDQDLLLEEKNTILETSLNILSHDTKNLFFNLNNLIKEVSDTEVQGMLKDNMEDLSEIIQEATTALTAEKRIYPIIDRINNIRVSGSRIMISKHDRISVEFKSYDQLFLETTPLLKNVIYNLTENALKYTSENSNIIIRVERSGPEVFIQFIDSGLGIPDEEKIKILDKFYRRKNDLNIEGSGRGLWITKNILAQEGGKLIIEDNPEGGTIFSVILPAFKVENMNFRLNELVEWFGVPRKKIDRMAENLSTLFTLQERTDIEDLDTTIYCNILKRLREENNKKSQRDIYDRLKKLKNFNPDGKTIVIVDDSLYVQYYLGKYFVELGYRIAGFADNGRRGVTAYKKLHPDLITLDNTMPVLSGLEAAEEIFQYDKDVRIIFISALGDSKLYRAEIEENYMGDNFRILTKPIEKEDLERILEDFPTD